MQDFWIARQERFGTGGLTMPDLIDRKALLDAIINDVAPINVDMICKHIHNAPTITPESLVKYGRWIRFHWHNCVSCADCSECGAEAQHYEFRGVKMHYNYCPNCGAKMDLEDL